MAASLKELRIGLYVPKSVQLLDLSPIDLFAMLDPAYLSACDLPAPLVAQGMPSTIHIISITETGPYVDTTAKLDVRVTKTTSDLEVQPGNLDIILVPGPDPHAKFDEKTLEFLKGHADWRGKNGESTDILSICTGCFVLGYAGIFKGKKASGPRPLVPQLRKMFPETTWVEDKRWVHDGNIWSSGGVTNGQEMVAAYLREKFPGPVSNSVIAMADVGTKGIDYEHHSMFETVWWLWQIVKASTMGKSKWKRT
ncbi:PfpI endopeptidase-like protein [Halenospora varia]|nr:PfpI endopeptidase-like protein [Halenospora varia]